MLIEVFWGAKNHLPENHGLENFYIKDGAVQVPGRKRDSAPYFNAPCPFSHKSNPFSPYTSAVTT